MIGKYYRKDYESYEAFLAKQYELCDYCNTHNCSLSNGSDSIGDYLEVAAIVQSLSKAKDTKLTSLRSTRNSKDELPVTTTLGSFDFDSVSQSRIRNAITITTGTRSWTLADGTTIQVTATDLQNVIAAGAERSDTLHNTYLSLKAQVAAATTVAEVEAIVWP